MKKEYFLLLVAIIALSAYLFFNSRDQGNSMLPEIPDMDETTIESIEIIKDRQTIHLFKDQDKWVITDKKFEGNERIIKEMTASIKSLLLTTLISENGDLKRYDLDKEKAIKVIAKDDKDKIIREISIGKTAPTQRHTFITLNDTKNVFHAAGNLKRIFNKTVDGLRDKQIQKFNQDDIFSLEISKGNIKRIITKKTTATKEPSKKEPDEKLQWQTSDNAELKPEAADSLVETLSDLRCSSYIETQAKTDFQDKPALLKITLKGEKTDEPTLEFTIFPKAEFKKYPGISSKSRYLFLLDDYIADDIISNIDNLLNIKQKSENNGENS